MSKRNYLLINLILLCTIQLNGQNKTPTIVNENILQKNYKQSDVSIYPDSANGFIVTWEDHRFGSPHYYAQQYDKNSQKVDEKFRIKGYFLISYSSNNKLFGLYRNTYSFSWPGWDGGGVEYLGEYFNQDQIVSEAVYLGGGDYPWCGTGWPGEGSSISRFNDEILTASDFGGNFMLTKFNALGENSLLAPKPPEFEGYGNSATTSFNSKGESIFAYYSSYDYENVGIYIQSFAQDDSLLTYKKIKERIPEQYDWEMRLMLRTVSVSDTLFQLFYIDSLRLKTIKLDIYGNIINENEFPIFYQNEYPGYFLYNLDIIAVSNFSDDSRAIILTIDEYDNKYSSSLYYFDQHGELIGDPIFDSTFSHRLGGEIFKNENNELLFPAIVNDRAYLMKYNNFTFIDSTIISNEEAKTNEYKPRIVKFPDDQFFITYRNEARTASRNLSEDGMPLTEEKQIDSQSYKFFSDGRALRTFIVKSGNNIVTAGYSLYDRELNVLKTDTLVNAVDKNIGMCIGTINPSDEFVLIYQNLDGAVAAKFSSNGDFVLKSDLSDSTIKYATNGRIFYDGETTFAYWNKKIHTLESDFSISKISKQVYTVFDYFGNNKFASSGYDYDERRSFYNVLNSDGDTLVSDVTLCYRETSEPMVLGHANNDQFIQFYLDEGKLKASSFNGFGESVIKNFVVHALNDEAIKDITFAVNGEIVLFSWAAKKIGEYDYDINCVSYDLDQLTDIEETQSYQVPAEYVLEQNYPNPFNPSTTIKYTIPSVETHGHASVQLVVYDVLGREVATLVNEQQKAGYYEVQFDASNLTSGVYFYRIQSGSFAVTKKLILLR